MAKWSSAREDTWRDVMEWRAQLYPDKVAVINPETNKQWTFKELNERVNRLANALINLGVRKGDRVAVLATNIPEYIEIASTSKAGIVYVGGINWRLKGPEVAYIINDSGANTVFVERQFCDTIRSVRSQLPNVRHFICIDGSPEDMLSYQELISKYTPGDPSVDVSENDILAIIYTSGTTGLPKGVIRKHKDTLSINKQVGEALGVKDDDRCLPLLPLFHVGLIHLNFSLILAGATQWLVKRFDPELVLELIQRDKITFLYGVPTMVIRLTEHPNRTKYDTSSLRLMIYVGSPMPAEAARRGMDAFGPILGQVYSLTEGGGLYLSPEDHKMALKEPGKEGILSSVGKPSIDTKMRLVDENDNDVPPGEVGEIVFPSIIEGYWNKPEETSEAVKNGWLHTGDLAKVDKDGYVYVVDRKKDLIVSGGENISSVEVENIIYGHPAVLECAAIGVPSEKWGEEVKAVVALRPGMSATPEEIMNYCEDRLAGFKKPKSVEIWPELPKNPMGKILKGELKEKYWAGHKRRVH